MKKSDREIVFNKFGGRCAYCGCELVKGWHVVLNNPPLGAGVNLFGIMRFREGWNAHHEETKRLNEIK